jgi:Arc/MetJ-type ribon-helix-helix transcriptional regulator
MFVNSIPIYWGNPKVGIDFNPRSFVNVNDFQSYDEVIRYIIELDTNEERYLQTASEPWLNNNKVADEFSEESFLDFFDFVVKDSKTKMPVAKSLYHKNMHRGVLLKEKIKRRFHS